MIGLNKIVALTAVSLVLSACASSPRPYQVTSWHKEAVSSSMTKDKIGHCKIEVGASNLSQEQAKKLVSYCMKADGYKLVTETKYR